MRARLTAALVLVLVGLPGGYAWGQGFRMVPIPRMIPVRIPYIPIHPPIYHPPDPFSRPGPFPYGPANTAPGGDSRQETATDPGPFIIILGLIVFGALGLLTAAAVAARKSRAAQGRIRIISAPPGEAPGHIRAAWVGLELPLAAAPDQGQELAALGVLSWKLGTMRGYAVDGRAALKQLEVRAPEAAAWWRANVPRVLQPGFQFIFPATNCEKLVGKGEGKDSSPRPPVANPTLRGAGPGGWLTRCATAEFSPSSPGPSVADLILSSTEVEDKARQTERLLQALAGRDRLFDSGPLRLAVLDTFSRLQNSLQGHDRASVRRHLMPGMQARHEARLQAMRERHEKICIEDLRVERLEFVHVCCPEAPGAPEITVLITFTARVFFVDDRTGGYRRGLKKQTWFQEFWVFRRPGDTWLLNAIEEWHESERLRAANRVASMTDAELHNAQRGVIML